MHFQERERQGELGATLGDSEVTGVKQHELVDWYFAHQSERSAPCLEHSPGVSTAPFAAQGLLCMSSDLTCDALLQLREAL